MRRKQSRHGPLLSRECGRSSVGQWRARSGRGTAVTRAREGASASPRVSGRDPSPRLRRSVSSNSEPRALYAAAAARGSKRASQGSGSARSLVVWSIRAPTRQRPLALRRKRYGKRTAADGDPRTPPARGTPGFDRRPPGPVATGIGDVWICIDRREFAAAKRLGRDFAEDLRLLQDLGWAETIDHETVVLTAPLRWLITSSRWRPAARG